METKIDNLRAEIFDRVKKGEVKEASLASEALADIFKNQARYAMAGRYYSDSAEYCFERVRKVDLNQRSAEAYSSAGSFFTAALRLEKVIDAFLSNGEKDKALEVFETIKNYLVAGTEVNKNLLEKIENKLK